MRLRPARGSIAHVVRRSAHCSAPPVMNAAHEGIPRRVSWQTLTARLRNTPVVRWIHSDHQLVIFRIVRPIDPVPANPVGAVHRDDWSHLEKFEVTERWLTRAAFLGDRRGAAVAGGARLYDRGCRAAAELRLAGATAGSLVAAGGRAGTALSARCGGHVQRLHASRRPRPRLQRPGDEGPHCRRVHRSLARRRSTRRSSRRISPPTAPRTAPA